jgi:hypothetical protein
MPIRIQRRRTKGWRMPPGTIYVGRGSRWGNPFWVGQRCRLVWLPMTDAELLKFDFEERDVNIGGTVVRARKMLPNRIVYFPKPLEIDDVIRWYSQHVRDNAIDLEPLRGKDLACWCPLTSNGVYVPCHADVLLSVANDIPMRVVIDENICRAKGEAVR